MATKHSFEYLKGGMMMIKSAGGTQKAERTDLKWEKDGLCCPVRL